MDKLTISIELIQECIAHNRAAQKRLYQNLLPYLNPICKRYLKNESEAQDVLQETFINIFKNLHQYDLAKSSFKTWATKIAINNSLKNNGKNSRGIIRELVIDIHSPYQMPKVFDDLTERELLQWLKMMPPQYFEVFNLYIIDGFSHAEIAVLLDINESLSRKRLSRSRDWVKKNYSISTDIFSKMILN